MCIALFRGGGLTIADAKVKQTGSFEYTDGSLKMDCSLNGLSCRWHRIPSKLGCVLSLLICGTANSTENAIYDDVLSELDRIGHCNPVHVELATYKSLFEMVRDECRFNSSFSSTEFLARCFEIFLCVLFFRLKIFTNAMFDTGKYAISMRSHTDYRKFDDMLRMVVDCTDEQTDFIENMLEERKARGQLLYGIHRSKFTLMTCLVEDVGCGKHIHFVDGDNGGYAMAAKGLKKQIREGFARESDNEACLEMYTSLELTTKGACDAMPSKQPTLEGKAPRQDTRSQTQANPVFPTLADTRYLEFGKKPLTSGKVDDDVHDLELGHVLVVDHPTEVKFATSAA